VSDGGAVVSETEQQLRQRLDELVAAHEQLQARVAELESGLDQERRLHRRVAELTDLVQEALLPAPQRSERKIGKLLKQYSNQL
jgi:serine phosphatase RsbU (regulator of sigma subunit)